jgi:2-iminobutanoate/2-iminopropanoate deaminase
MVNDFLYVSGQGPTGHDGKVAADFDSQMRQSLENLKAVLQPAGLIMQHLVYAHVYLTDMSNYERMNALWAEAFPQAPPARAVLGVYKLPVDSLVTITAVAFKDLSQRSVLVPPGYPKSSASPGVMAGEKVYLSGSPGVDLTGKVPADPAAQVEMAFAPRTWRPVLPQVRACGAMTPTIVRQNRPSSRAPTWASIYLQQTVKSE